METLQVNYKPEFREQLFAALKAFKPNDVQIIEQKSDVFEDEAFINHRNYLHQQIKKIDSGESKMYSLEEVDAMLDETISNYEN